MLLDLEKTPPMNRERLTRHAAGDPWELAINMSSDDRFYYVDEHESGPPAVASPSTAPSEDECRAFETSLNDTRGAERIQDRD